MKILLYITSLLLCQIAIGEEDRLSDLDKQIIEFFREGEIGADEPDYPDRESYYDKIRWYWGLGQKARPALMYLLTEKYEGDFPNMSRAIDALSAMDGDRSDVVGYVRNRLPDMVDSESFYGKDGFIQVSLRILAFHGNAEDMDLIVPFLEKHYDVLVRSSAMTQQRNLQQRIDAGEFDEPKTRREPGSSALDENNEKPSESVSGADDDEKPIKNEENDSTTGWALAALVGLLAMALLGWWRLRIARRSNNQ